MDQAALIDTFAAIDEQIKALETQKTKLREHILALGAGDHLGDAYQVKITVSERASVDWKAVAAKLNPSHQLVAAHTRHVEIHTVKTSERKDALTEEIVAKLQLVA